jgi:endonuclease/exonuclease/phosphatase (EEP) superfamily protein YafD
MIAWLLALACLLVALATALSFMRDWRLALASHFRPHLAVASVVLAILVSIVGLPGWAASLAALLALVAAAANLFAIWRVLPSFAAPGGGEDVRLRLAFANVLATNTNGPAVVDWVRRAQVDLFVACECASDWPGALAELAEELPNCTWSPLGDIMVFSRLPLGEVTHPVTRYGNVVVVEVISPAGPFSLVALHAALPLNDRNSTGRDAVIESVGHIVRRRPGGVVVVGDFNATPWSLPMRRLMAAGRLHYGPGAFRGTYPSWVPDWAGLPIDMVLAGGGWRVVGHRRGPRIGSDHWPVLAEVAASRKPAEAPEIGAFPRLDPLRSHP